MDIEQAAERADDGVELAHEILNGLEADPWGPQGLDDLDGLPPRVQAAVFHAMEAKGHLASARTLLSEEASEQPNGA